MNLKENRPIVLITYGTALIGFMTAICAFVPYVGAFMSAFVGVLLILMVDPVKALLAIPVYAVTQFVENQFIYPHVVGGSVGLMPFWTLVAAILGGKLFGLIGIIFFIPLAAIIYELLKSDANRRLEAKKNDFGARDNKDSTCG